MKTSKEEQMLATGSVGKLFIQFGIPGVLGLLLIGFQPMVDGLFLINFVGPDALAGVNLFVPVYTFVSALAVVVGIGSQTIVSLSLGEKNYATANDSFRTAGVFLAVFLLALSAVCYAGAEPLSRFLGADADLQHYTVDYIRYLSPFLPVLALLFLGDYMLKATARPYLALSLLGLVLLLNIVLDYLLVAVMGAGVKGAALATGISLSVSLLLMAVLLLRKDNIVCFRKGKFRYKLLWNMLYNGSSEGLSELSAGITVFLFNNVMMDLFGKSGVAAFTSVNYLLYLGVQLYVGLSDGIIPILSYNYGAGNKERVRATIRLGRRTNLIIGLIFFALLFWGGTFLVGHFFGNTDAGDVEVIKAIAVTGATYVAFAFFFNGQNILSSSLFTSMGDARTSVVISLMRGLLLVVIGIFILPLIFGNTGIWLVIPLAELVTLFYCLVIVRKKASWLVTKQTSQYG